MLSKDRFTYNLKPRQELEIIVEYGTKNIEIFESFAPNNKKTK